MREPIAFYLLIDGMYEIGLVQWLLTHLGRGATFVDVGANIGVFAILAGRKVGPTGSVLALEPSPRVFPYLYANVISNRVDNVVLEQCAACEKDQEGLLFYEAPDEHFGMGALAPQFNNEPVTVRGCRLDSVLERNGVDRVDIMKVDVEGSEAYVFRGSEKLLTGSNPPTIVFEVCDWAEERFGVPAGEAQRVLRDYGYNLWPLDSFKQGSAALETTVTTGFHTLVAVRRS